jgi:hypothetical protein
MPNPLDALTDDALWNSQLFLALSCGRSRSQLRERRRQVLCALLDILKQESNNRGISFPNPPYHPGDTKPPKA